MRCWLKILSQSVGQPLTIAYSTKYMNPENYYKRSKKGDGDGQTMENDDELHRKIQGQGRTY